MIVHLVTDRTRLAGRDGGGPTDLSALLALIDAAIAAGIDVIQLRERDLEARQLATLVAGAVARAAGRRTRIVVNDRVDLAIACGAAGVHLRGDSVPAAGVRRIAPSGFIIGRSVHSVAEAVEQAPFVDYLVAGTVWATASKPAGTPLLGVDTLSAIARAVAVPVLGIGGVTIERAGQLARAGAAGAAAIGLFQPAGQGDPSAVTLRETVEMLRRSFDLPASGS
ncbi:MAG TPA: thiamine phosphate synthase [Vicinamibacterales bacterium]